MPVVGIDACKKGWIAVVLREGVAAEAHYLPTIGLSTDMVSDAQVVAIDIPIGLPTTGYRAADLEGQRFLQARRSSLFRVPCRAVLEASTHAEANALSVELGRSGISQQAYALGPKIFQVEEWLPTAPCGVYEVHPEISFAILIGTPASAPKKTWAGMVERREALAREGITLDHLVGPAAQQAAVDDMLDAAVAAWTADRILKGLARPFPATPGTNADGRAIAIWA